MKTYHTIIIGTGAAGLAAGIRLNALGVGDIAFFTEGLKMGTSINTGSDKQTYYKLGMYGAEPDSPVLMARDLAAGGSMHGDIALAEAAMSAQTFFHLVNLGVPFPHDPFGQHIGYKTDHDPRRRATSCGPYTSRDMCRAMIAEVKKLGLPVFEKHLAVKLLTDRRQKRVIGAVFLGMEDGTLEAVRAENVVFACGGPGGLYAASVYPKVHTGSIGLALDAGAEACNLAESQYGLASVKFRWNVSGSYMQVLPRFVSTDADGGDEREFLREYFDTPEEMYRAIFLKGYQWPFAAGHVPGSSLVDIVTYIETVERGRRVFLDYREDPADLEIGALPEECSEYLRRSGAIGNSPLERLNKLNAPAAELYQSHGIDFAKEMLEIAVCAQHNNGGLYGGIWWESTNLRHLFPVGEVCGTHGVTRPGGSALNSGQAGAFRAAEFIAARYGELTVDEKEFAEVSAEALADLAKCREIPARCDWRAERRELQNRMSSAGAFIREKGKCAAALEEAFRQSERLSADGLGGLGTKDAAEALRNRQLCVSQIFYLSAIAMQIEYIGSRGGSLVLCGDGTPLSPKLDDFWRSKPECEAYRHSVMIGVKGKNGRPEFRFEPCRKIPECDGWFENVWRECREGEIYHDL